jgi:hypothetical protein
MFLWRGVTGVDEAERKLDDELAKIEDRAEQESQSQRGSLFKRAGDLCAEFKGREKLAVSYYGKAIDSYIRAGMNEAATVLCRRLIRYSPEVVRAHFTLAALALMDERTADAAGEIMAYMYAAGRTRTQRLAIPRLRFMARATDERELRGVLLDAMLYLGDKQGAAEMERGATIPVADRRAALTELVTLDPHELWERAWLDQDEPADGRGGMRHDFVLREDLPPPNAGVDERRRER